MRIPSVYDQEYSLANIYDKELCIYRFKILDKLFKHTNLLSLFKSENFVFIADLSEQQKQDLYSGMFKFMKRKKNGKILAVLTNPFDKNRIVEQIPLKKVDLNKSDFQDINNVILQQSINEIMVELELLKEGINDLLVGQHNDRLAKAKSVLSQFLMIDYVDESLKNGILQNMINTSSESFYQLAETLQYNITKLKLLNQKGEGFIEQVKDQIKYLNDKSKNLSDEIYMQVEALIYSAMVRTIVFSKINSPITSIMPLNDLNIFLEKIFDEKTLYLINGWTENYPDFWVSDYKMIKKGIESKMIYLESDAKELNGYLKGDAI